MKCSVETNCSNPNLEKVDNHVFCFNCYGLYESGIKKKINVVMIRIYYILKFKMFIEIVEI